MRAIVKRAGVIVGVVLGVAACGGSRIEEWSRSTTAAAAHGAGTSDESARSSGARSGSGALEPRQGMLDAGLPGFELRDSGTGGPGLPLGDAGGRFVPPVLGVDGGAPLPF